MILSTCKQFRCLSVQKLSLIPIFFWRHCKDFSKLPFWVNLDMASHVEKNWLYQLEGKFNICLHWKLNFILPFFHSFFLDCKDIAKLLFLVLWMYLAMTTKNTGISFRKTLMFIFTQRWWYQVEENFNVYLHARMMTLPDNILW